MCSIPPIPSCSKGARLRSLVYSADPNTISRESLVDMDTFLVYLPGPLQFLHRVTRRRVLIRVILTVAVSMGITGAVCYSLPYSPRLTQPYDR